MSKYLCGLDIGGTFTDCVIVDDAGRVVSAKAPSTPDDFAQGLMNALRVAARKCGQPVATLLAETSLVSHSTTVGTNAIVQKRGARVGLVTTRGHSDVIHIMRGSRGIDENYKLGCNREDRHVWESNPLIGEPRDFIDDDVEFRQFSCPGCGTLIENEVAIASDPVLKDIELHLPHPVLRPDEGDETSHLLHSRRNAERLRASMAEIESGDRVAATLSNDMYVGRSRERK